MPTSPEQEPTYQEQLQAALTNLEGLNNQDAIYDRDILLGVHGKASQLIEDGFKQGEMDQPKAIESKLEAANLAREIAGGHGDIVTAGTMGQLQDSYQIVLDMLRPAAPTKPKRGRPAKTTVANTGSAKTP